MKKIIISVLFFVLAALLPAQAQKSEFNTRLKQFVVVLDNKYTSEINCEQAINLGFSINDYKKFVKYLDSLNIERINPIELPENIFLNFFIEYQNGELILNIPFEQAIKAGASTQGYQKILATVKDYNKSLTKEELIDVISVINTYKKLALKYAKDNPDKSACAYVEQLIKNEREKFKKLQTQYNKSK